MIEGLAMTTNDLTHGDTKSKRKRGERQRRANKTAKVKWGEKNERQMANNVMRGIRVCDGYLVCLDLCVDSPPTAPEILLATS